MFETLQRLWANRATNGMTEAKLDTAIAKGWINADQKAEIMSQ